MKSSPETIAAALAQVVDQLNAGVPLVAACAQASADHAIADRPGRSGADFLQRRWARSGQPPVSRLRTGRTGRRAVATGRHA